MAKVTHKNWTNAEVASMKLVGYERTKSEAEELRRWHEQETGRKCVVIGSGIRARSGWSDLPWQVRELNA